MDKELTLNLQIDQSPESLKRLCDGLVAAVKPDGGYAAATTDDPAPGTCGDQMVQVEWWIPQHGCDSLENTLDAIKGRLLVAVRDWFATALVPVAASDAPAEGQRQPLSPAAQAVLDAVLSLYSSSAAREMARPLELPVIAATIRALADHAGSARQWNELRAIAAELEGANG